MAIAAAHRSFRLTAESLGARARDRTCMTPHPSRGSYGAWNQLCFTTV